MHKTLLSSFITAVFAGFILPPSALAASIATTQVSKICEVQATPNYSIDQLGNTPSTSEQSIACNLTASGSYVGGLTYAHAEGYASAGFGSPPQIGVTSVGASTVSTNGDASAGLMSLVQFFLEIQPIATLPGTPPSLIPILLSATGSGYAQASNDRSLATTLGIVDIYGAGLAGATYEFSFEYRNVTNDRQDGSFDGSVPLDLYANYEYSVLVEAGCYTASLGSAAGSSASCSAWVDPLIAFDQAAFDALMGEDTYILDDHYGIVFSANVVPVPPAMWLFGSSLIGLLGLAHRKRVRH